MYSKYGKIVVLMGGVSSEREISLKSGKAVFDNLKQQGFDAVAVDLISENPDEVARLMHSQKPDCVFLALHGHFGEDGGIQKILDDLKIPYTGSGVGASKLAMDKVVSRKIFAAGGLSVPESFVLVKQGLSVDKIKNLKISLPAVIKPAANGSSIGLSIIDDIVDLDKAIRHAFEFDDTIIIERFIEGRELTVGIILDEALPVIEILPKRRFFDYEAKYQSGMTEYVVPAKINNLVAKKTQEAALLAHKLLGCYGCSRVDIIFNEKRGPVVIEVNTIPGMTQTSLLPKSAKAAGINFTGLCIKLIELAYEKAKQ